uniref:EF-hand domain-containing protein n=1 Tax=Heterorhabditis bacteriophora TaxID=37862 RepID=A0A1I7WFW5_HETBA
MFDSNGDGAINFNEFRHYYSSYSKSTCFREKDNDRDGVITIGYEEFLTMVFDLKV